MATEDAGRGEDRTDQAALFGAALTAVVALSLGSGAWQPLSTGFGVVLIAIICTYYKPLRDGRPKRRRLLLSFAASGVLGLCSVLALSWPIQFAVDTWHLPQDCIAIYAAEKTHLTNPSLESELRDDYSNCQGYAARKVITAAPVVTGLLWLLWTAGLVERRGWLLRWRRSDT